ncbi:MAG: amidohydrolase family protein, partial [Aquiluna sp.]
MSGIDCSGLLALPGFVDLHTHLREPGFEESETVLSGARSAAAGGYTTIFAMANSYPVADNAEA